MRLATAERILPRLQADFRGWKCRSMPRAGWAPKTRTRWPRAKAADQRAVIILYALVFIKKHVLACLREMQSAWPRVACVRQASFRTARSVSYENGRLGMAKPFTAVAKIRKKTAFGGGDKSRLPLVRTVTYEQVACAAWCQNSAIMSLARRRICCAWFLVPIANIGLVGLTTIFESILHAFS